MFQILVMDGFEAGGMANSVGECLPNMHKVLGLIPDSTRIKTRFQI